IDAHTHLQFTGQSKYAIDIRSAQSVEEALELITQGVEGKDPDAWVEVLGYEQQNYGRHLTAEELDIAGGNRRIWARHISSHASVVSTRVLDGMADQSLRDDPLVASGVLLEWKQ